jgi:choline dehydrogenase-like flavoprotein
VPEAVGVNPSRTIAALAERASALIAQDARF